MGFRELPVTHDRLLGIAVRRYAMDGPVTVENRSAES
ncbi:hypothetical protein BC793_12171 [Actinoplanes xinjiangensis]|jgi:hypothetical protein|uniref:Uncharacterized protein n=1 Tax=Actinoplanes xinjiangensis TaxID=512350 RepID=A0A316F569_9ACTN|nr:hypothetical protein BC793_12171 [Actinoplanes xinjiangensis]